jgi:hypothetical protein
LLLAVSATFCQWQFSAVFGGADNGANNTAAVATGGVNNSASGVYSSVVGGVRNKPPILPRWLLAVSAALPVAITLLFSAAQIMRPTMRRGCYWRRQQTLPVVCAHPWSAVAQ